VAESNIFPAFVSAVAGRAATKFNFQHLAEHFYFFYLRDLSPCPRKAAEILPFRRVTQMLEVSLVSPSTAVIAGPA
jgi:hypothetical protein